MPASIQLLKSRKFDAVIVDLQLGEQCGLILDEVHLSLSNRTAVTFAISDNDAEGTAFRKRSEFVFERPLSTQSIRSNGSAHPHPFSFRGGDLVADPFSGDFSLELCEGKQNVQGEPAHG